MMIEKIISNYEVISFDIFDTLIERKVGKPSDIFRLVGNTILGEKFAEAFCMDRIKAESDSRSMSKFGEVTLDEIYKMLDEKYLSEKKKLKEAEIQIELESCKAKEKIVSYFEYALSMEKKVYLISDMYLSSIIIEKMLKKCEIEGYEKIYVSNEYGKNKIDGKLFEQVRCEHNINRKRMLHIGDSIKADFLGAHKDGVAALLVRRKNRIGRFLHL